MFAEIFFMQTEINFETHVRENNFESEQNLYENRKHFSAQCQKVYELLMSGDRLTVYCAIVKCNVNSLPRRILDLKKMGVKLHDQFIPETRIKEWWMTPDDILTNKNNLHEHK